jgi:transcriptional regulator
LEEEAAVRCRGNLPARLGSSHRYTRISESKSTSRCVRRQDGENPVVAKDPHWKNEARTAAGIAFPCAWMRNGLTLLSKRKVRSWVGIDLPQGTLDLLILKALESEPRHGWAVAERISAISRDVLRIQQGSLYPALHRLERRGWIKARWGESDNNRRAKFYEPLVSAVGLVLETT